MNKCNECKPGRPCDNHAPEIVRDGQAVRVSMTMMDSMQRSIAGASATIRRPVGEVTDAIRAQAQADHDAWKSSQSGDGLSAYDAQVLAANAQSNQQRLVQAAALTARVQGSADHFRERYETMDAVNKSTPAGNAYADMCVDMQHGR